VVEVGFSARTERSLRAIDPYVGQRNPMAAERVVEDIEQDCSLIGDYPVMGAGHPGDTPAAPRLTAVLILVIYGIVGQAVEVREVIPPGRTLPMIHLYLHLLSAIDPLIPLHNERRFSQSKG
jgi:toxin ParE1/3/4